MVCWRAKTLAPVSHSRFRHFLPSHGASKRAQTPKCADLLCVRWSSGNLFGGPNRQAGKGRKRNTPAGQGSWEAKLAGTTARGDLERRDDSGSSCCF